MTRTTLALTAALFAWVIWAGIRSFLRDWRTRQRARRRR